MQKCHSLHIEAETGFEISFAYTMTMQNDYYVLELLPFGEICTNMGIARNLHWDGPVGCMVNHCAAVQCNTSKDPKAIFFLFLQALIPGLQTHQQTL